MASGIDGPGDNTLKNESINIKIAAASDNLETSTLPDTIVVTPSGSTRDSPSPETHLNFSQLLATSQEPNEEKASSSMERTKADHGNGYQPISTYNNPSEDRLSDDMEKVFETTDSYKLDIRFDDPSMAAEVSQYGKKLGEKDYDSHRRSHTHHYHPMATHLSSQDMKTIESAHPDETRRRRHRRSRRDSDKSSKEREQKIKKRTKKKKKNLSSPPVYCPKHAPAAAKETAVVVVPVQPVKKENVPVHPAIEIKVSSPTSSVCLYHYEACHQPHV